MSNDGSSMREEMTRLVKAVAAANPAWDPSPGATVDDLADLRTAFAPRVLPEELGSLLEVMNGDPSGTCAFIDDSGSLLRTSEIITETASRAEIGDTEESTPWCRSMVVITSRGWDFAAVLAGRSATGRSPVFDLSYGNQDIPVSAASLTALVAASAEAWEQGRHERQNMDSDRPGHILDNGQDLGELQVEMDAGFPSTDRLAVGDGVTQYVCGWPSAWLAGDVRRQPCDLNPASLEGVVGVGREGLVQVTVAERHGRWVLARQGEGHCWLDLSPGFERDASPVVPDSLIRLHVMNVEDYRRPRPPALVTSTGLPCLRVIGFEHGDGTTW